MDVITLYGKKAVALNTILPDTDNSIFETKTKQKTKVKNSASIPFYAFGNSAYSPKRPQNEADFYSETARRMPEFRLPTFFASKEKSKKKNTVAFPKTAYFSDLFAESNIHKLIFSAGLILILAVVPYTVCNIMNNKFNSTDWTDFVLAPAENQQPQEILEIDEETGEEIKKEILTLEKLFEVKLQESEERLLFSENQNEAQFDSDGNLIFEDGFSIDSIQLVEPVTYSKYTVKSGETIDKITYKFGLRSISTLIAANDIKNVRTLMAGQKLIIPSQDGLIHKVASGESLNSLSVKYHISVEDILDTNDLTSDVLSIGQKLFIPGAKLDSEVLRNAMGETFKCPISAKWRLTSHFGRRTDPISGLLSSHTGIDMACATGTPIYAAMSGTVVKAGWSNIYGNYVIIKHPNGYQSLYGHMTKFVVRANQLVDQGTKIGFVGSTGYSTGPHLHLTIYKNGKMVDPLPLIKK